MLERQITKADIMASSGRCKARLQLAGGKSVAITITTLIGKLAITDTGMAFASENIIVPIGRWRALTGDQYWYVGKDGLVWSSKERASIDDTRMHRIGNYFKNIESAKQATRWIYGEAQ